MIAVLSFCHCCLTRGPVLSAFVVTVISSFVVNFVIVFFDCFCRFGIVFFIVFVVL